MDSPPPSFAGLKRKVAEMSSDEEESRPSLGFRSFQRASSRSESPSSSGLGSAGRSPWSNTMAAEAVLATSTTARRGHVLSSKMNSAAGGSTFAQRMMAKMGYVEGRGLGSTGQGIVSPIEAQARPQGIGLGAVREKTEQAREEEKREAARRGEVLETSSDEERRRRQRKKEERRRAEGGRDASGTTITRVKPRFRTTREMEADMAGLEVPNVLKSLIDATGKEHRILTSTAGLMTPLEFVNAGDGEALKIARRARHDLEAFADEWKGLIERKKYIEIEEAQIVEDIDTQQVKMDQLTELIIAMGELEIPTGEDLSARFEELTSKLETMELNYRDIIEEHRISETAVAAIHPLFRQAMEKWDPLQDPEFLLPYLRRLKSIFLRKDSEERKQRQSTSPYETMMYTLWLPRVRSALLNDWDVYEPTPAITLFVSWKDLLPPFVSANVLDQLVVPKLSDALKAWKPRSGRHHPSSNQTSARFPWWLFSWLQYLDDKHTNPKHATGLLSDAKRKFRVVLDTWNLHKGLLPSIELWRDALGSEFDVSLQNHLLPRLARHLRDEFEINPQDQNMTALEDVLNWKSFFKPSVIGLLLVAEFFPKWHHILHVWLTNDPNYEEVGQWFTWWRSRIPEDINALVIVDDEWMKALHTMNLASELGDRAAAELPPPPPRTAATAMSAALPSPAAAAAAVAEPPSRRPRVPDEVSFKDILETWCAEHGLIMLPLREAHPQTGQPLFRITASATARGGVVAYVKGDVVWVQNKQAKNVWDPVGLEDGLIQRAEGK